MTRVDEREFRRALAALKSEAGDHRGGLWLGIAICAALCGLMLLITAPWNPIEPARGVVIALGFGETDDGSRPYANVSVDGGIAKVRLPMGSLCQTGDHIQLERHKAPLGYRYSSALAGCTRP